MADEFTLGTPSEEVDVLKGKMGEQPEIGSEIRRDEVKSLESDQISEMLPSDEALEDESTLIPEVSVEPGPDSGTGPKQEKPLEASDQLVEALITPEALAALWARADRAQEKVKTNVKALGIARELLDLIQAARNEILAGKDHYEEAERYLNEVEFRVDLSSQMANWTKSYGIPLFIYEVIWGIISFSVLLFWMNQAGDAAFLEANSDYYYFLGCIMWGGIGGVVGALISLVKHISIDQDFDRQHLLWYIGSPIVGFGVGAVIFLVLRAGLLSLTGPGEDISSPVIMYALAWLSGYQQNIFTDMLKRFLKVFSVGESDK